MSWKGVDLVKNDQTLFCAQNVSICAFSASEQRLRPPNLPRLKYFLFLSHLVVVVSITTITYFPKNVQFQENRQKRNMGMWMLNITWNLDLNCFLGLSLGGVTLKKGW